MEFALLDLNKLKTDHSFFFYLFLLKDWNIYPMPSLNHIWESHNSFGFTGLQMERNFLGSESLFESYPRLM